MSSVGQAYEGFVRLKRNEAIQPVTNHHGLSGKGGVQLVPPLSMDLFKQAVRPYEKFVQLIRHGVDCEGGRQIAPPLVGATR